MTTGRTYQGLQKAIDDFEEWLGEQKPADYQPSPRALEALYLARDEPSPNIMSTG